MAHHAVWEGRRWARVGAHRVGLIARAPTRIIAGDARHAVMVSDVTIPTCVASCETRRRRGHARIFDRAVTRLVTSQKVIRKFAGAHLVARASAE